MVLNGIAQQSFLAGQLGESVIYTDINPDIKVDYNSQYLIDIDNNGVADFKITQTVINGPSMSETIYNSISGLNKNKILYSTINMDPLPYVGSHCGLLKIAKIFNYGDSIYMQNDTIKEVDIFYSTNNYNGNCSAEEWHGIGPKYIGVVLNRNDSLIYGWIKVDVPSTVTVMEYAINSKGITQIQSHQYDQSIKIFPNPVTDFLHIFMPSAINGNHYNLSLMNDLGVKIIGKEIGEANNTLDMSKLATGIYLLVISDHSRIYFEQTILKE